MHVHLVFVTKYRRGVFTAEITGDLSTKGICIQTGKQAQGCFKPNDPEEKVRDT
jgi:REP element-mobilizing transposase RayT